MMSRVLAVFAAGALVSTAAPAFADEPTSAADAGTSLPAGADASAEPSLVPAAPQPSAADARLEKIEAELAEVKDQLAAAEAAQPERRLLSFWGFMDTSFGGVSYDHPNALYRVQTPHHATFFSSGVNLYAKSEMTSTLSALVEVRLTYSPDGYANSWPGTASVGNRTIAQFGESSRVSTAARGPYSQLLFAQSGLLIERAHVDWRPADWFGIRVGRFLTPFGIWNEDHGSPVLLGVDYPQLMNFGLVPIWQIGLQAFGVVHLGDRTHLDYAATLTNTRGPYEFYKDTTDFKAFGGRLKLVYDDGERFHFRIGAYGYVNQYRDTDSHVFLRLTPSLTIDRGAGAAFGSTEVTNGAYDETVVTGDLEVRWRRFRVFGEVARQSVVYQVAKKIDDDDKVLQGAPLSADLYDASHYGWAFYVLGGYEIPIKTSLLNLTVTPYAGYDRIVPSTVLPVKSNTQIRAGFNIRPSPYITLKLEGVRLLPESPAVASDGTALMSQLAVAF